MMLLVALAAALQVTAVSPPPNTAAPAGTAVALTFDPPVEAASVTAASFRVFGRWSGAAAGAFSFSNGDRTVTFTPSHAFSAGEIVSVNLSHDIRAAHLAPLRAAGFDTIQANSARWDPIPGELSRIDRFIQSNEVNGITLDSRPLTPYSENIRLSVIPQLLGYYELYKKDNDPSYYEDIVDRAEFLIANFDVIRSSSPFDGMLGYALLSAYEVTGNDRYLSKGQEIVDWCIRQPQGIEMSLNWGLMGAMVLGKYYELTNDTAALNRAKIIIDSLVPIQDSDGSFPHYCANSKDILYTAWMSTEFIVIKDSVAYRNTDIMLERAYRFLKARYDNSGQPVYRERMTNQWVYYYSQGSGCLQDYDTRGWINELGYTLLTFDHFNDANEYLNAVYVLVNLSNNGAYKDKWAYPHQPDDPVYLYSIGDPSIIRTSNIFWSLTMAYTHSGSAPRVYNHEYEYTGAGGAGTGKAYGMVHRPLAALEPAGVGETAGAAPAPRPFLSAWPNPTNARVVLRYRAAAGEPARLAVYDVAGREVAVVAEGALGSGLREITWDGTGAGGERLPAGEYLVRLSTASGASVARVVLLQ